MAELLSTLAELQKVEKKIAEIRSKEQALERRLEAQKRKLSRVERELDERKRIASEHQRQIDYHLLDIATREEAAVKHREALNRTKTKKDYDQILTAINTELADTTKIQKQANEFKDRKSEADEQVAASEKEWNEAAERLQNTKKELDRVSESIKGKLDSLLAEKGELSAEIPSSALSTFNRVAERHDGEAMVPLVKAHPKREEFVCSGCNMRVTLELLNSLKTGTELQYCKVCGRILYLDQSSPRERVRRR